MSLLTISSDRGMADAEVIREQHAIGEKLRALGVRFEQWQADCDLTDDASQDDVLAAYRASIDRLNAEYGFQSVDVVSLRPDHPQKDELRQKFLAEHTHSDFEMRFFVDGTGLFYLHPGDQVYCLLCEAGDLVSVPADTPHWFDMGAEPSFKCIRFFSVPDGWQGNFTGAPTPRNFPDYDAFVADYLPRI